MNVSAALTPRPTLRSADTSVHTPPVAGHRAGEPGFRRLSLALFFSGLTTFSTLYCPQALLPDLASAFGVGPGTAALVISIATICLAVGMLVVAPLSDARGRTWLIHASLLATSVAMLGVALAPTWGALLALRAAQGFALAGLPAIAMAYLREEVDRGSHARATGLYIAGNAIGGMTGRLVAGAVAEFATWRVGIAAIAVLGLASAVAVRRLLPPSRRFVAVPAEPAAMLSAAGRAVRDPVLLTLYGVGAALMGSFVALYNVIGFRLEAAPYRLGAAAGLVYLVYPIGSLASTYAGRVAERIGRRRTAPVAALLGTAGICVTLARPLPLVVVGVALLTSSFFAAHSLASGWVAARAHAVGGAAGFASSVYLLAYYAGGSVFGAVAGAAWAGGGWPWVVALIAALTLVATTLTLALNRPWAGPITPAGEPLPVQ